MKLCISRSKNSCTYYVTESFRRPDGRTSSRTLSRLGSEAELRERLGEGADVRKWAEAQVEEMRRKSGEGKLAFEMVPGVPYEKGARRHANAGYLLLQQKLYSLGFRKIAARIAENARLKLKEDFKYDLEQILVHLACARFLDPGSKRASMDFCRSELLEQPSYGLHDVYRALDAMDASGDLIQELLYKATSKIRTRPREILYYDCTNYYFEIGREDELRRYGRSKENRPNPIVQMGLFIDGSGIPLAFSIFPGNQNEQGSLKPLEMKILKDFGFAGENVIVCTDAGLAADANRRFNAVRGRQFVTVQPLKTLPREDREWALAHGRSLRLEPLKPGENPDLAAREIKAGCWRAEGVAGLFSIDDIDEEDPGNWDRVFYKEKLLVDEKGKRLGQRMIVTYSLKYKRFSKLKRERDIERARDLVLKHNSRRIDFKSTDDVRQYIVEEEDAGGAQDGAAKKKPRIKYRINEEKIEEMARFDGFYAVTTSISSGKMPVAEIIRVNRGRWEIEEAFRILKSDFQARPVYVRKEPHIRAHFTVCFIALLLLRLMEADVREAGGKCTAGELIKALRGMRIHLMDKGFCSGDFTRTDLTDTLMELSGMRLDCNLITPATMDHYIAMSKFASRGKAGRPSAGA